MPLISGLDTFLPLADSTFKGIQTGSFLLLGVGVAVYYVRRVFKKAVLVGLIAMGMSGIVIGANANTIGEFGLEFILLLLLVVFCFAVVRYLLRNNLLAYVLTGFLYVGLYDSATLSSQSNPIYALNGWIWLALCLLGTAGDPLIVNPEVDTESLNVLFSEPLSCAPLTLQKFQFFFLSSCRQRQRRILALTW